jgi:serine/threonine-protein kinase RsbW
MKRQSRRAASRTRRKQRDFSRESHSSATLTIEFCSDPKLLSAVRAAAERLAEAMGFAESEQRSIVRALDEALSNIIRHCYCGKTDRPIAVQFREVHAGAASQVGLEMVLTDEGPSVDYAKLQGRELNEVRPGGLGLHLIRESMEQVEFSRRNGKNRLRLVKYRGATPAQAEILCR